GWGGGARAGSCEVGTSPKEEHMRKSRNRRKSEGSAARLRVGGRLAGVAVVVVAVLAVAGVGLASIGIQPTGAGAVKVGKKCGNTVPVGPKNKGNAAYRGMSRQLQNIYSSYPDNIFASPWATKKIKAKAPWKIGYIAFAITNQYNNNVLKSLKNELEIAKKKGLVTGNLVTNIPATMAQSTPEGQIAAIQQMVRQGVNAIILLPVDSVSETPAMEAAGK